MPLPSSSISRNLPKDGFSRKRSQTFSANASYEFLTSSIMATTSFVTRSAPRAANTLGCIRNGICSKSVCALRALLVMKSSFSPPVFSLAMPVSESPIVSVSISKISQLVRRWRPMLPCCSFSAFGLRIPKLSAPASPASAIQTKLLYRASRSLQVFFPTMHAGFQVSKNDNIRGNARSTHG